MRVNTEYLIPGCIVTTDVMAEASYPIVPKDTVLTEQHITFLQKFLIESVHVSKKLADGSIFEPGEQTKEAQGLALTDHYQQVVAQYEKMFAGWQNHFPIDMKTVQRLLDPLLEKACEQDAFIFKQLPKADSGSLASHAVSLSILAAYTGKKIGYEKEKWLQIGYAAFLADSGISQMIKEGNTIPPDASQQLQKHPAVSYKMVENLPILLWPAKIAVLQHQEQLDGSGYPLHLTEAKINEPARILSFCDHYYVETIKKKKLPAYVLEEMRGNDAARFDQVIVSKFREHFLLYSK